MDNDQVAVEAKRGRGRPKKGEEMAKVKKALPPREPRSKRQAAQKAAKAFHTDSDGEYTIPAKPKAPYKPSVNGKRGRGRPKKEEGEADAKKGRGRPKKNAPQETEQEEE